MSPEHLSQIRSKCRRSNCCWSKCRRIIRRRSKSRQSICRGANVAEHSSHFSEYLSYLFVPPGLCIIWRRSICRRRICRRSICRKSKCRRGICRKLGVNVLGAIVAGAFVVGAFVARANVAGAYVAGAFVAGANVARATVAGANVAGAFVAGANLARAFVAEHSSHFSEHLSSEHLSPEHMSCHLHNYTSRSSYNTKFDFNCLNGVELIRSASFFGKIVVTMATLCMTNTKNMSCTFIRQYHHLPQVCLYTVVFK